MRKQLFYAALFLLPACINFSCQKENIQKQEEVLTVTPSVQNQRSAPPSYNLEVVLHGEGNRNGHIHFRQDANAPKIITLDTKVHHLLPNHPYLLQRAVDRINVVDGNCTSTSWLTLGHGLTPQSIMTNEKGNGQEELLRNVTAIPSGSTFDIHFRVIDGVSLAVVLTSDCYQFKVR